MKVDEFIKMCDEQVERSSIIEEMKFYNENPESLKEGSMFPNFENMEPERQVAMYHFYVGMIYGVGLANKHDIGDL